MSDTWNMSDKCILFFIPFAFGCSESTITSQLLDLSLDTNQSDHTVNFNNNSLITSAPLVTSDSHEAKGKQFAYFPHLISSNAQLSSFLFIVAEISLL